MFVTSGRSRLEFIGYVSIEDPKRFCGTVAEVMDAEAEEKRRFIHQKDKEWRNEFFYTSRPRSSRSVAIST